MWNACNRWNNTDFSGFLIAPKWQVLGAIETNNFKKPNIKGNENDSKFQAIKLAKEGYYGGNVSEILKEKYSIILDILTFENYCCKYEIMMRQLNKPANNAKNTFKK